MLLQAASRRRLPGPGLLLVAMLCGCGAPPPRPVNELAIIVRTAADVPPGAVYFKPIPGGLAGKAVDAEFHRARGTVIEIDAAEWLDALSRHATVLQPDAVNPFELIQPHDARVARLAAFYEAEQSAGTTCTNVSTGLRDARANRQILLYVDRPATVIGARYVRPYIYEYDLRFPERGVYLVDIRRRGYVVTPRVNAADERVIAEINRAPCGAERVAHTG